MEEINKTNQFKQKLLNFLRKNKADLIILFIVIIFANCFKISIVIGDSMYPTYHNGQLLFCCTIIQPNDQDVVVIDTKHAINWDKEERFIIKRYYKDSSTNGLYVMGDNVNNSYDSKYVGEFDKKCYKAKVLFPITK